MMRYFKVASVLAAAAGALRTTEEDDLVAELGVNGNESAESAKGAGSALLHAGAEKYPLKPNQYIAQWLTRTTNQGGAQLSRYEWAIPLKCKKTGLYLSVTDQVGNDPPSNINEHCVLVTCDVSGKIVTKHLKPCPAGASSWQSSTKRPNRFVILSDAFSWKAQNPEKTQFVLDRYNTVSGTWDEESGGLLVSPSSMGGMFRTESNDNEWTLDVYECKDLLSSSRNPYQLPLPTDKAHLEQCEERARKVKNNCIKHATAYINKPAFFWKCEEPDFFDEDRKMKIDIWVSAMQKFSATCKNGFTEFCACGSWAEKVNCEAPADTPKTLASKPVFFGMFQNTDQHVCEQKLEAEAQKVLRRCEQKDDEESFCHSSQIQECVVQDALPH